MTRRQHSTEAVAGLDIGTTTSKALIRRRDTATPPLVVECPTRWTATVGGGAEVHAETLLQTAIEVLARAIGAAEKAWGTTTVRAVSVTGLAESGVLLDRAGSPTRPAIAWFDTRGRDELADLAADDPDFVSAFAGVTGLPYSPQASIAKLLWLRYGPGASGGAELAAGSRWLSVPEWIVHALGGDQVREPSLASRTGLIEQRSGHPWGDALDVVGAPLDLLPPAVPAGTPVGRLAHADVPSSAVGALLSVAGHDHPVAALGVGAAGIGDLFNSAGTADVLARAVAAPLTDEQRAAVVAAGWSAGAHVLPGVDLLLGGGSGGLLLRRVLAALGADAPDERRRLDRTSLRTTEIPPGLVVRGDSRSGDDVEIRLRDGATPATVWRAATSCTADLTRDMLADIEAVVGPHTRAVAAGGWSRMASVREAKASAIHNMQFSDVSQPGASGAADMAERSLERDQSAQIGRTHPRRPSAYEGAVVNELTTLERRAMSRITTPDGRMLIVAADQRNSMKAVMHDAPAGATSVTDEQLAAAKADLVRYLGNHAPAILLDPEVALPRIVDDGVIAGDTALVVAMDASGYETVDGLRYTRYVPGISPRRIREYGGDAAKMLFYLRPDRQPSDSDAVSQIRDLVTSCEDEGLLLIVEILTYRLDGESEAEYAETFPSLVIDSARLCVAAGAKVLKLPYPGSAEACAAVTEAARGVPWAVLSAGVDHETFVDQVATAVAHGAHGAMAGRSLWKDSLAVSAPMREQLLTGRAYPRLTELEKAVAGSRL